MKRDEGSGDEGRVEERERERWKEGPRVGHQSGTEFQRKHRERFMEKVVKEGIVHNFTDTVMINVDCKMSLAFGCDYSLTCINVL